MLISLVFDNLVNECGDDLPTVEVVAEPLVSFHLDSVLTWLQDRAFMVFQRIGGSWLGFLKPKLSPNAYTFFFFARTKPEEKELCNLNS